MDRRRNRRIRAPLSVRLWGVDAKGLPFTQLARVKNISGSGALIEGMLRQVKPGETLHVQFGQDQSEFRVVWAGKPGTQKAGEIGVESLAAEQFIWEVNLVHCSEFAALG